MGNIITFPISNSRQAIITTWSQKRKKEKQNLLQNRTWLCNVLEEPGMPTDGSYLCVVLPEHPEEVQHCVGQRALSGDVLSGARHSLDTTTDSL